MFSKGLLKLYCKLCGAKTGISSRAHIREQQDPWLWQLGTRATNYKNIISPKQIYSGWFWYQCSETVLSLTVLFPIYCSVTVAHCTYSLTQHFNFITTIMSMAQGIFSGSLLCSVTASVLLWKMQQHFFKVPAPALCWLRMICLVQREGSDNVSYPVDTIYSAAFKWLNDHVFLIASGCTSGHQILPSWPLIPRKCSTDRLLLLTYAIRGLQCATVCLKITWKEVRVRRPLSQNVS